MHEQQRKFACSRLAEFRLQSPITLPGHQSKLRHASFASQSAAHAAGDARREAKLREELEKLRRRRVSVRGLRVCQDEDCKLPQNRDRTGASNIGLQFTRLFGGQGPLREMTTEDLELHRNSCCIACEE